LIPLVNTPLNGAIVNFITAAYRLPAEFPITAGEDVIVMGYPLGFSDSTNNLPLFRTASIASVYGVNFQGLERCILDGNIQPGMSGSPIFMKPTPARINKNGVASFLSSSIDAYFLLGILSQAIPVPVGPGAEAYIGLADCWYPDILEDWQLWIL